MRGDLKLNAACAERIAQSKLIGDLQTISYELAAWARNKFDEGMTTIEVKETIVEGMRSLDK